MSSSSVPEPIFSAAARSSGVSTILARSRPTLTSGTSFSALSKELDKYEIGDTVKVEIYRNNERMEFEVTLQENTNN